MDDYIFLIIAVALSIIGAINQSKKKKAANNQAEKAVRPRNFFMDQLLGEDFLTEPKVEVKPGIMLKPGLKKEPLINPAPVVPAGVNRTRFVSTLPDWSKKTLQPSMRKPIVEIESPESETEEMPGYLEDFSLRKAFVYYEIMQRKY